MAKYDTLEKTVNFVKSVGFVDLGKRRILQEEDFVKGGAAITDYLRSLDSLADKIRQYDVNAWDNKNPQTFLSAVKTLKDDLEACRKKYRTMLLKLKWHFKLVSLEQSYKNDLRAPLDALEEALENFIKFNNADEQGGKTAVKQLWKEKFKQLRPRH